MRNRIKEFSKRITGWVASNIAWDVIKYLISLILGGVATIRLPDPWLDYISNTLSPLGLSSFDWFVAFILISSTTFGALSLLSPLFRWIKIFILQNDKPNLIQGNEWNAIINFDGKNVGVAMISIENKPTRKTDNNIAYNVSAYIDFFDRKDNHLLHIKCGYWTRTSPEKFFANSGKKKKCGK